MDELNRVTTEEFKAQEKIPLVVVMDNVRSMYNVGSVFRTCDAFSVERLLLCGITACPPHKEIAKTALGATESVEWKHYGTTTEAVAELKQLGYKVFAVEQVDTSVMLDRLEVPVTAIVPESYKVQADALSKALKMGVKVSRDSKGKGSLTINFKNDEEFERLLDFINKGN